MCITSIAFKRLKGRANGVIGWFPVTNVSVCNDHPHHAELEWCINVDVVNEEMGPSARLALELTLDSAIAVARSISKVVKETEELESGATTGRQRSRPVTSTALGVLDGSAKGEIGWFPVTGVSARNGHPLNEELEWCVNVDVTNDQIGPNAKVSLELDLDSAKALADAIMQVVHETEQSEAELAAWLASDRKSPMPPG